VTAVRNGAESSPSRAVRATPNPPLPATPTRLVATVSGPGEVTVTWKTHGGNAYYWVYYRDRTAKQTEFTRSAFAAQAPPSVQSLLVRDHVYEFTVTAVNQAGESPKAPPAALRIP
jgi:fibronectin type III domain protein